MDPLLGPLLVFVAYLAVVNARYPGGWVDAAAITIVAWLSVLVVLYVLALVGVTGFDAVGVPGCEPSSSRHYAVPNGSRLRRNWDRVRIDSS